MEPNGRGEDFLLAGYNLPTHDYHDGYSLGNTAIVFELKTIRRLACQAVCPKFENLIKLILDVR